MTAGIRRPMGIVRLALTILVVLTLCGVTLAPHTDHKQVAVGSQSRWTDQITGESDCGYQGQVVAVTETTSDGSQYTLTCAGGYTVSVAK